MTPRTPQQNEEIQEASRRKIIEAALKLFAERGYDNSSVKLIANEAGISQGLLYNYFNGKQDLLVEIMKQGMLNTNQAFVNVPVDAPPLVQLAELMRGIFIELKTESQFWRVFYSLRNLPAFEEILGEEIIEATLALRQVFETLYRQAEASDAELRAYVLYAMIEGLIQQYLLFGDDYPLSAVVEKAVKLHCQIEN